MPDTVKIVLIGTGEVRDAVLEAPDKYSTTITAWRPASLNKDGSLPKRGSNKLAMGFIHCQNPQTWDYAVFDEQRETRASAIRKDIAGLQKKKDNLEKKLLELYEKEEGQPT